MNTPPNSVDPATNPKAAAKAAKAYAKASRPWFKKKRFLLPGALVVIIGITVASSSDDDSGPQVVDDAAANSDGDSGQSEQKDSGPADPGTKGNPVEVGSTVDLEGTRYTVDSVDTANQVGENEFLTEDADGTFVMVTLTIENTKDETKTFSDSAANVVGANDKSYQTDNDGTFALMGDDEEPLWLTDMQPDLPKTGRLVYDVPGAALDGAMLEVSDLFGGGEAYIDLGV